MAYRIGYGIVCIIFFAFAFFNMFYYIPTKERKEQHRKKALELTKTIGNKSLRCVSLLTNRFNGGRVFYVLEENAEKDSTKHCHKLEEGWENSAHPVEEARRNTKEIISFMPYSLWIDDLDISEADFFAPRKDDRKTRDVEKFLIHDFEKMDMYLFPDLMEKELHIVRFNHTTKKTKYHYYVLVVEEANGTQKYLNLFYYPDCDNKYAQFHVDSYISRYNSNNPWGGKINTEVKVINQEINDFLKTHPLYTHQYLYRGLKSIKPYYDTE